MTGSVAIQADPATGQVVAGGTLEVMILEGTVTIEATTNGGAQVSLSPADFPKVHFDFNSASLHPEEMLSLYAAAQLLDRFDRVNIRIEGHCDQRGTKEYNQALGRRRADNIKAYLVALGIDASRISIISFGKERPLCEDRTEACWQENRRAEFEVQLGIKN